MTAYSFKETEQKWQKTWADEKTFEAGKDAAKPKAYVLEMFPYPSGHLHMGHVRNYAIGDAIARFKKAQGFDVMHPMGWDAFGLPAENAAAQHHVDPAAWTKQNIQAMKAQFQALGFGFGWEREIATCDPGYYGLEQKIFLDFWKRGLAYRRETWVNWDPAEGSVLANEQVINGRGWRSNALVEKRKLTQWSLKITAYAQELLDGLGTLKEGWPENVILMQENWIGRSEGALIRFELEIAPENADFKAIEIFTTRPETLFGASFCALAPTHPLIEHLCQGNAGLTEFVAQCQRTPTTEEALGTQEKLGFPTGYYVRHPFKSGERLPIYATNFVLMDYGTGAIFGCPAHDERDFAFAIKYNLPVLPVIQPEGDVPPFPLTAAYIGAGILTGSDFLNGLAVENARALALEEIEKRQLGERRVTYRLRDWCISRQRYWGCPIPVIHCDACGPVAVPEKDLPVVLPVDVTFGQGGNPLENHPSWKHVYCPRCAKPAVRETDTLDTFVESSWYFLRYCNPVAPTPVDRAACEQWMPVDWYIGGVEHAVLHLLYARFFTKALRDCGYISLDEPFKNLLTQGMVCHQTFKDASGQWLFPHEVEKNIHGQYVTLKEGAPVQAGRSEKMSKSWKNLVDPQSIMDAYGADAARLFVLSDTPPDRDFDWNDDGLEGAWRYINRVWRLGLQVIELADDAAGSAGDSEETVKLRKVIHQALDKVHHAYVRNGFNKAIACLRELTHKLEGALSKSSASRPALVEGMKILIQGLHPVIPHVTSELWERFPEAAPLTGAPWPEADAGLTAIEEVTIVVQVNGKTRGSFQSPLGAEQDFLEKTALEIPSVMRDMRGRPARRIIIIPNRIINIVV